MKHLSALLILLLVCFWSQTIRGQATDSWVSVSLAGERFAVLMPNSHVVKPQQISFDKFKADGRVYTATSEGVDFTVWSLVDDGHASSGAPDSDAYLDACADLVWESLLKPLRDELPKRPEVLSYMSYQRELEPGRLPPGREYTILLGNKVGVTHFYVAGPQIYVLTALNANASFAGTQRFINSFGIKGQALPVAATPPAAGSGAGQGIGTGAGIGPGRGGNISGGDRNVGGGTPSGGTGDNADYNRIFSGREVTEKARVLSKPEPQYTESARKYSVVGTVILRAVFARFGEVNNIKVVTKLPHGLTQQAVSAARQIRFTPASKDGHAVSMYIQLEYNFNLY
jgi:TonB family protein